MREIIECVPSFSTAHPEVVEAIVNENKEVKGAYLYAAAISKLERNDLDWTRLVATKN